MYPTIIIFQWSKYWVIDSLYFTNLVRIYNIEKSQGFDCKLRSVGPSGGVGPVEVPLKGCG